jgi:hypothetical protein
MTPADIERMAREAGMWQDGDRWFTPGKSALDVSTAQLARFAALVEAAERERCAELCEQWDATHPVRIAAAIRGAV